MTSTRWDEKITNFLKGDIVKCFFCKVEMIFVEQMGYFKCPKCSQIKAPNLIGKNGVQIPLYWSMCRSCNTNNITEADQEPYWIKSHVGKDGKIITEVIQNEAQRMITCSNCGEKFQKQYPKSE